MLLLLGLQLLLLSSLGGGGGGGTPLGLLLDLGRGCASNRLAFAN